MYLHTHILPSHATWSASLLRYCPPLRPASECCCSFDISPSSANKLSKIASLLLRPKPGHPPPIQPYPNNCPLPFCFHRHPIPTLFRPSPQNSTHHSENRGCSQSSHTLFAGSWRMCKVVLCSDAVVLLSRDDLPAKVFIPSHPPHLLHSL